jgi:hypothetical protein
MRGLVVSEKRLYGLPDADMLYDDPATVWETHIEPEPWGTEPGRAVIEEWTVHDPTHHLPSHEDLLDYIYEWACDAGEVSEDWGEDFPTGGDAVHAAIDELYRVIASNIPYRMANEKVAEHVIEWTGEEGENPMLDGEPMYRKSEAPSCR